MPTSTLSSKHQISIPKEVRDALGLEAGDKVVFLNTGTGVYLVPALSMNQLAGIAKGANVENYRDRDDAVATPRVEKRTPAQALRKSAAVSRRKVSSTA